VVTNDDLSKIIDTMTSGSKKEQGFKKKTHNKRRRYYHYHGVKAAEAAIARSGLAKKILICRFANFKSRLLFSRTRSLVQRDLGLRTVGALDGGIKVLFMPCLLINILKRECIKTF
jgi:3-oxoacyl-[acyl-carrier-protein] synthase III